MQYFTNLNDGNLVIFLQPSLITERKKLSENERKYLKKDMLKVEEIGD